MTTEERLQNLEQELSRVRRRNRWLSGAVMLCLGISLAFWAFRPPAATAQDGTNWWEKAPIVELPVATVEPASAQPSDGVLKEVRANKFVLVDDDGKMLAQLGVDVFGPTLSLSDKNDKVRAWLGVDEDGPLLQLSDDKGKVRALLGADEDVSGLSLFDDKGKGRCTIGAAATIHEDGRKTTYPESSIWLFGPDGKGLWSAPQ